ncbi:MAG: PspA/IM30 family protein [Eggerthellaceae bacterium]|jgi:phage shock protein A|nr:PspA/IM30 family protein [Eggerthellaceae bacterium]MDR2715189.1 PspA/IM30 family protein [Coriobacteriaceae bacterium]
MGILERFSDIVRANINELLDKAEDPAKMIDQYMRDLTDSLAQVRSETAGVMAEETRAKRLFDDNAAEVEKFMNLARKALEAGNEDDARKLIEKKQKLDAKAASLKTTYEAARDSANKMREMHDKLVSDIDTLKGRQEAVKAKAAVAKTQEKVNNFTSGADKAAGAMGAFDRMEAKAEKKLDHANAVSELNQQPTNDAAALEAKYSSAGGSIAVEDEIAQLKKELGL